MRKRDKVKNALKSVLRKDKAAAATSPKAQVTVQQDPTVGRKMQKAKDGKKYENIDCIEEKAYQILKDLNMIEEHN